MTFGEMRGFTTRLNTIVNSRALQEVKDTRLASLMTDLEQAYSIPMLRDQKFEELNPHLMQLYRTVSEERVFS